jgi:EAL domain-containing protein (putative c-di-GMP-specific phosphodiesterase class I)
MGKSLQPQKAIAVRQPANTPAAAGPAAPAPNEPATAESLGWQLRAALPPLRLHSVSICDEQANVLWLSEGALGPDEHNVIVEAIDALGSDPTLNCYETGLEDGRVAIFLPVRAPQGGLVGLAMILADIKSVGDGVLERIMSPQVRPILQKVAVLLRPAQSRGSPTESLKILELAPEIGEVPAPPSKSATPVSNFASATPAARNTPAAPAGAGRASPPMLTPQAVDDILEFELTPDLPPAGSRPVSQTQRLPALSAVNGADLNLDAPTAKPAAKAAPVPPKLGAAPSIPAAVPTLGFAPTLSAASVSATSGTVSNAAARTNGAVTAPATEPGAAAATPAAAVFAAAIINTSATAASGTNAATRRNASPAHSPSLAEAFDLDLPQLNEPAPAVFADNVAQFPTAASAPAPVAAIPVAVPVVAPATSTSMNGAAAPTTSAPAAVSSSATTTSKTLTGTAKTLSSTDTSKALGATSTSRVIALPEGVSLILEVLPFSKLRAGGRTRRYEVQARPSHPNRMPAAFDKIALQQLLAWMGTNRSAWSLEPTSFTLNLSISTLEDERFPQFVASTLKANGIAPDNIGFEIAEPLCLQRRAQVERFITLCDKLGCFVVIDDFSLDSSITGLLRSKALRLVKIDPKLTSVALKDKLAQAMVVAIAQAVKVLGIHCAAKRVDTQASLQWLTAIGCDFAQGTALGQIQALETLGTQPPPVPSP